MAYRRPYYRKTRRFTRRYGAKKTYTARRPRYPSRRPTYRRRRPMTTRRVLNVASKKKKDNMMVYTNVSIPYNPTSTYTSVPAALEAKTGTNTTVNLFQFLWCPTARTMEDGSERTDRNSTSVYMRGLKESVEITTNSGTAWSWRRIVFTRKGSFFPVLPAFAPYKSTSNGYARVVNSVPPSYISSTMWEGAEGVDWLSQINAKVNRDLQTVLYDKTITLQSNNSSGMTRVFKRWHGFNKNLVYQDDESGDAMEDSVYSTQGRKGMGDCYVLDILQPAYTAAKSDALYFNPEATLYWHEK